MEAQNDNSTSNISLEYVRDNLRGARDWFYRKTFGSSPSNRLANTERELEETKRELEEIKHRLSAIISSQIRDNNPNLVNLGDQYRPNKLGEMSSELYDNEWTDALKELARKSYTETESIRIFLDIIMVKLIGDVLKRDAI